MSGRGERKEMGQQVLGMSTDRGHNIRICHMSQVCVYVHTHLLQRADAGR